MTTLVFLACLLSAPDRCTRVELPAPSAVACMVHGQQAMAEWLAGHPRYRPLPGWRCERGQPA